MKAVITVIGHDTVGVVARVSAVCAELNINIEDITQSILQDMCWWISLPAQANRPESAPVLTHWARRWECRSL